MGLLLASLLLGDEAEKAVRPGERNIIDVGSSSNCSMCSPTRSILILRGRGHIWDRGGNSSTVMEIHCGHPCSFVTVFILQMSHARVCRLLSWICRCSFFRLHQSVFILSYLDKQLLSFSSFAISPLIDVSHPSPEREREEGEGGRCVIGQSCELRLMSCR